jgi:hypothetical protein
MEDLQTTNVNSQQHPENPTPDRIPCSNEPTCKCMVCKKKRDDGSIKSDNETQEDSQLKYFHGHILEVKESDDDFIVKGYLATTHIDSGGDKILKETLDSWAKEINADVPRATKFSYRHNRKESKEYGVAGKTIAGTAKVVRLADGEHALYAETKINKSRPDIQKIEYEVKNGFTDAFSIEYTTVNPDKSDITGAVSHTVIDGKQIRILHPATQLHGHTLAAQPMNEYAVMLKESYDIDIAQEKKIMEQKEFDAKVADFEAKEKAFAEKEAALAQKEAELKAKESTPAKVETKETKEVDVSTILQSKEFEAKVDSMLQKKGMLNMETEQKTADSVTVAQKEYSAIFSEKGIAVSEQFARAGRRADELGLFNKETKPVLEREYKSFGTNGRDLQYKSFGIGSNQNSSYVNATSGMGIAQAELQDVFDPVIYNALNEATAFYNILAKDNFSSRGTNNVSFVLKIGRNPSAGAYIGNEINLDKTSRTKYMTKFKKYQCGWAIDGDLLAASRGSPIGDLAAREIEDATLAMKTAINIDLFGIAGLETAAALIGLRYISRSATYTTLYGTTRSATNKLSPDTATDTYTDVSTTWGKNALRKMIRYCVTDGSRKEDLLFVGDWSAVDSVKTLFDNAQRINAPTMTRFGFETDIFFEGIPVMGDKDAPSGSLFCVDTRAHRLAIFVPPTVEMLGKRSDAVEGFIKAYIATYNTSPRRLVEAYNVPTPA